MSQTSRSLWFTLGSWQEFCFLKYGCKNHCLAATQGGRTIPWKKHVKFIDSQLKLSPFKIKKHLIDWMGDNKCFANVERLRMCFEVLYAISSLFSIQHSFSRPPSNFLSHSLSLIEKKQERERKRESICVTHTQRERERFVECVKERACWEQFTGRQKAKHKHNHREGYTNTEREREKKRHSLILFVSLSALFCMASPFFHFTSLISFAPAVYVCACKVELNCSYGK